MSVTTPRGFLAAGVAADIKGDEVLDLAIVAAAEPAVGAAVFTVNRAAAAPVVAVLALPPAVVAVCVPWPPRSRGELNSQGRFASIPALPPQAAL